jgi:hypothetical protein
LTSLICQSVLAEDQLGSQQAETSAEFLMNFARFTEWPEKAFPRKDSPLVIGVVGHCATSQCLEQKVRDQLVRGRKLSMEYFPTVQDLRTCHMLYIGRTEADRVNEVVQALEGKPVLIVSDIQHRANGVMIRLFEDHRRIRFEVDLAAIRTAGLSLSAKLLRAAHSVNRGETK